MVESAAVRIHWPTGMLLGLLAAAPGPVARAQSKPVASLPDAPTLCSLSGRVSDTDGMNVPGATVKLMTEGQVPAFTTQTDVDGAYAWPRVPCGQYVLVVTMAGFQTSATGESMSDAGMAAHLDVVLRPASTDAVTVTATRKEIAAAQIHLQEQQRMVGVLPNFYVSYQWHAEPMTTKQKYKLALRQAIDPASVGIAAITAGAEYASGGYDEYGSGAGGFGYLFGTTYGLGVTGGFLGGAVFPSLFHQDPRYFYRGTGSVPSRAWYAISRSVITRGDNGKSQMNYSGILGDFASAGVTELYVPAVDRKSASYVLGNGALGLVGDCVNGLVQEFVLRHFTTKTKGRKGKASDTP